VHNGTIALIGAAVTEGVRIKRRLSCGPYRQKLLLFCSRVNGSALNACPQHFENESEIVVVRQHCPAYPGKVFSGVMGLFGVLMVA